MKETYLLKFESPKQFVLCEWVTYKLHLETVYFWGLFKKQSIVDYIIYDYQDFGSFLRHWNELIEKHLPIKTK